MADKKKICIVGSGNWGTVIAEIIGVNSKKFNDFDETVNMYVYEEIINGEKLSEIINRDHENVKYLPGHKLTPNIIAVPDIKEAVRDADILIFVAPHQFIRDQCEEMKPAVKKTAIGLSLIKGVGQAVDGGIQLITDLIKQILNIEVFVLMGANIASEVAEKHFCETTIGCNNKRMALILKEMVETPDFKVTVIDDAVTVELCGALKNVVACAAGLSDGLGYGDNTKSAIIRLGFVEMMNFCHMFYGSSKLSTYNESCGIADLITTCYGGRNRKVIEAFVKSKKSVSELEEELLNGQKLQGPITAAEINVMIKNKNAENEFPLFVAVHKILNREEPPNSLIDFIRNHPEYRVKLDE